MKVNSSPVMLLVINEALILYSMVVTTVSAVQVYANVFMRQKPKKVNKNSGLGVIPALQTLPPML
jgi:hypothetical protein